MDAAQAVALPAQGLEDVAHGIVVRVELDLRGRADEGVAHCAAQGS
jgi:hypothetical protein